MPQEFIYLILLTTWLEGERWMGQKPIQVLELFSGKARVSKMASYMGLEARAVDIDYDRSGRKTSKHSGRKQRSSMDFCGEAGFVSFGYCLVQIFKPQTHV